ncbi:hypothetical protein [Methylobacterium sp. sgz302541]|uniref:hypothetical protein n=1 Tax=unclassified Methylobacterium TaxID=2615210 RepID=UPI003D3389E6
MRFGVLAVGIGVITLAGCMTGSLVSTQGACTSSHAGYLEAWDCIKAEVAAKRAGQMNNDLGIRYMATGDAIAERVRRKELSDADARLLLARELSSANGEFEARKTAAAGVTCNSFQAEGLVTTNCY